MATEVTKLISVSLGKIQRSRQSKNGLNLRKSLLVASVLHKARDIYVLDLKHKQIESSDSEEQPTKKCKFQTQRSVVEAQSEVESDEESQYDAEHDSLSEPDSQSMCDDILDQICEGDSESTDKENSPPSVESVTSNRLDSLSCKPCLKRQLSNENSSQTQDTCTDSDVIHTPKKRQRIESLDCTSSTDSAPINNLVQIFNSTNFGEQSDDKTKSTCSGHSAAELNSFSLRRDAIALTA